MRHIYRCPLRWSDMDAYGHVNNAIFLRYLEEARIDFLSLRGEESKQGSVVARHEIDYKRQLVHRPTPVDIELWVTQVRAASFTVTKQVKEADVIYVP
ncbi:acyl-CoA thioesterase, partial [Streptomyces sp. NPDC059680]|uniref:acyl-CoA thioesterase n=1 Tax=Streptomyces sp. NPDC059680 TaxID=3346904 RepID=UPI0036CA99F3